MPGFWPVRVVFRPFYGIPAPTGRSPENEPGACRPYGDHEDPASPSTSLLVQSPEQRLPEEREQLDERDSWIALVEVGPIGVIDGDSAKDLAEELRVSAVVQSRPD